MKQILNDKGITQRKFSELLGKEETYISKVCNDKVNVSLDTVMQFSEALKINPAVFFQEEEEAGNEMIGESIRGLPEDLKNFIRAQKNGPWLVLAKDLSIEDMDPNEIRNLIRLWKNTVEKSNRP